MDKVIATTLNGKLRGVVQKGLRGQNFYAFKGIPYAKPPVGQLRFRDPEPVGSWSGIRDATSYGSCGAQIDFVSKRLQGNEDCLHLNVFTKDMNFQVGRPVIVWIHASFFVFGSGDDWCYGPDYFMHEDVVFITINHRLGVLGFLNLDDEEASGNQAMKDQVMALQWVRDNVANFGGDPNNVTIAGVSAGACNAHLLTLSPLARGLFHKAIFQSSVALNPWTFFSKPKERVYQLCQHLGHSGQDSKSIIQFLKTFDAQRLALAQEEIKSKEDIIRFEGTFGPSIDSTAEKPFMPIHPEIAATEGVKVPLLIGHTSREGLFVQRVVKQVINQFDKEFGNFLHRDLIRVIETIYNLTIEDVKRIYFNNDPITPENMDTLIDLLGDFHFVEGVHRVMRIQAEKRSSPTYFYRFSYDKSLKSTSSDDVNNFASAEVLRMGAGHTGELPYQFRMKCISDRFERLDNDPEKRKLSEQMIKLWVNFATTGNPTPKISNLIPLHWQPIDDNTKAFRYLEIGENLRMNTMPNLELRFRKPDSMNE